jgi:hypothetical protein
MKYIELYVNNEFEFTMPLFQIHYSDELYDEMAPKENAILLYFRDYDDEVYRVKISGTKEYTQYIEFLIKGGGDFIRIDINTKDKEFYYYSLEEKVPTFQVVTQKLRDHDYHINENGESVLDEEE